MRSPVDYFTELTDPHVDRTKDHLMEDIIFTTIATVICGAETWNDIEQYGKSRQSWLSQYLRLPNGIPSDTFNRFFSALDPDGFEGTFLSSWIKDVSSLTEEETVSMDSKTIRGSRNFGRQACGSYSERPGKRQSTEFGTGKGGREVR